ncbi:DUF6178 family protein [Desulforhabdus sp. TSK]|uniref:DUF6178 family protein n=1 Tax=Desulforhabdus sp. TSK TaxID=2925014 RepID=UPI001FC84465|nr:DUF6178 family protein [Desulforhabdus sp. TSK]GKT08195.1 hypothetical protein DSTSK_15000 [Desulforhabdus sp. TSK]
MKGNLLELDEKRIQRLSPRELSSHLMRLPAKQRMEVILSRADAEAVVAALAPQDFYFSVKEIGSNDASPLLALASVEQTNHLFDLEWWQKDALNPAQAVAWLERLAGASEERLLAWIYHADFELLVTLFKRWISVATAPEDIDLLEARDSLPPHTLEDQYFWECLYPQYEGFIMHLLSLIFEANPGFYGELMSHILFSAGAEVEEDAYWFHKGRLEDQAIPDFYDALEIYRSVGPEELSLRKEPALLSEESGARPSFALALVPQGDLLGAALQELEDPLLLGALQMELAGLANKVIVADQLSPDHPEALRRGVDKAVAYVNLGLEMRSAGNLRLAEEVLENVFLEHLFRWGHEQVIRLRNRLRQIMREGWLSLWPPGIKCLDAEWLESAELLAQKTPRLLRSVSASHPFPQEDFFRTRGDLAQGKHFADMVEGLGPVFDALEVDPGSLGSRLWHEGLIRSLEDVTLGSMIWTAAARFQGKGAWKVAPIPVTQWPDYFPLLTPVRMEETIRVWLETLRMDASNLALAREYLEPLFREYSEDMGRFAGDAPPDAQLMKFFMFSGE